MTADDRRPPLPPPVHPDLDTLADLHAGALDAATGGRVRAHVSGCPRCTAALAALDAVGADLRSLPAPVMPAAVAARLDATLADLRRGATGSTAGGRTGPATGPTAAPDRRSGDPAFGPTGRLTAPTGPDRRSGDPATGPTGRPTAPTGPDRRSADPATGSDGGPVRRSGNRAAGSGSGVRVGGSPVPAGRQPQRDELAAARDRRHRRAGRAVGAVAAGLALFAAGASVTAIVRTGGGADDSLGDTAAGGGAGTEQLPGDASAPPDPASLSIPSYDRGTLRADLPEILQESAVSIITGRETTGPAGVMSDPGRRTACQNTIRGSSGDLRAVRRIEYEGRPAFVFVFSDDGRTTAYVVSEDCGTSPALPASVLDTVS